MDFSYSEEQEMLRDGLGKFLEKNYDFDARQETVRSEQPWSKDAWRQYTEFGLLALPFAEEQGGLGGSLTDVVAVSELFGKHLTAEPYIPSIMLAGAALAASDTPVAQSWLEKLIGGEAIGTFAYEEGHGTAAPELIAMTAKPTEGGYSLSGEKRLVIAGAEADVLIVLAKMEGEDGLGLFLVEGNAQGLNLKPYDTVDGRRAANIGFDNVVVDDGAVLLKGASANIESIINRAIIALAAEALGAMGALVALTGEYAGTRKQFGVPIGTFQSVAHRLADMKIAFNKARATLIYTAALAESGGLGQRDVAILKGQLGKLGRDIGEAAIQTHGGVGMTDELNISHYHKRLLAFDAMFGEHGYHFRKLGISA